MTILVLRYSHWDATYPDDIKDRFVGGGYTIGTIAGIFHFDIDRSIGSWIDIIGFPHCHNAGDSWSVDTSSDLRTGGGSGGRVHEGLFRWAGTGGAQAGAGFSHYSIITVK